MKATTQQGSFPLKTVIILSLIAIFAFYGFSRAQEFRGGPKLVIIEPTNGEVVSSAMLKVRGTAENIAGISLNGNQIFVDENGNFSENLLLARGYSIIEVQVQDKFGRKITKTREVILK